MIDNTAKKYVKALIESYKQDELKGVLEIFKSLSLAFELDKFNDIVNSPTIKDSAKVDLILSFIKKPDDKISNLIKLLAKNRRINLIPQIFEGLRSNIAATNNEFHGKIYSSKAIEKSKIKELETQISKKFNANVKLEPVVTDYNGVKIDVEDLGFEISFSIDRLKNKMSEYILKAI